MHGLGVVGRLEKRRNQLKLYDTLAYRVILQSDEVSEVVGQSVGRPPTSFAALPAELFENGCGLIISAIESEQGFKIRLAWRGPARLHLTDA